MKRSAGYVWNYVQLKQCKAYSNQLRIGSGMQLGFKCSIFFKKAVFENQNSLSQI